MAEKKSSIMDSRELQTKLKSLGNELRQVVKEKNSFELKVKNIEVELSRYKEKMQMVQKDRNELQMFKAQLMSQLHSANAAKQRLTNQLSAATARSGKGRVSKLEADLLCETRAKDKAQKELKAVSEKLSSTQAELLKIKRMHPASKSSRPVEARTKSRDSDVDKYKKQIDDLEMKLRQSEQFRFEIEAEKAAEREQAEESETVLRSEMKQLLCKLSDTVQTEGAVDTNDLDETFCDDTISNINVKLDSLVRDRASQKSVLDSMEEKFHISENRAKELERELDNLRHQIIQKDKVEADSKEVKKVIEDLKLSLLDCEKRETEAIEEVTAERNLNTVLKMQLDETRVLKEEVEKENCLNLALGQRLQLEITAAETILRNVFNLIKPTESMNKEASQEKVGEKSSPEVIVALAQQISDFMEAKVKGVDPTNDVPGSSNDTKQSSSSLGELIPRLNRLSIGNQVSETIAGAVCVDCETQTDTVPSVSGDHNDQFIRQAEKLSAKKPTVSELRVGALEAECRLIEKQASLREQRLRDQLEETQARQADLLEEYAVYGAESSAELHSLQRTGDQKVNSLRKQVLDLCSEKDKHNEDMNRLLTSITSKQTEYAKIELELKRTREQMCEAKAKYQLELSEAREQAADTIYSFKEELQSSNAQLTAKQLELDAAVQDHEVEVSELRESLEREKERYRWAEEKLTSQSSDVGVEDRVKRAESELLKMAVALQQVKSSEATLSKQLENTKYKLDRCEARAAMIDAQNTDLVNGVKIVKEESGKAERNLLFQLGQLRSQKDEQTRRYNSDLLSLERTVQGLKLQVQEAGAVDSAEIQRLISLNAELQTAVSRLEKQLVTTGKDVVGDSGDDKENTAPFDLLPEKQPVIEADH